MLARQRDVGRLLYLLFKSTQKRVKKSNKLFELSYSIHFTFRTFSSWEKNKNQKKLKRKPTLPCFGVLSVTLRSGVCRTIKLRWAGFGNIRQRA
jgi:hypothetical protein